MSGGGGTTTVQSNQPWAGSQPFLMDVLNQGRQNNAAGPAYYPGQTFVSPTEGQIGAWDTKLNYADNVFAGANAPRFDEATGTLSKTLTGNTQLGGLGQSINPLASGAINTAFSGGPKDYSSYFKTSPDYQGVQGAIDAANAPILRNLNENIIPGLNSRATFLNNPTGGIKTLNRALPDIGQRMSENALSITEGERRRALSAGEQYANFDSQNQSNFRSQALGLGGLGANISQGVGSQQLQGLQNFGSLYNLGQQPGQLQSEFAEFGANAQNKALQDQISRFNYYQNLPDQQLDRYGSLVTRAAGLGGTSSSSSQNPQQNTQNLLALAALLYGS